MIQNDRRRTNSAVDKILVVNESITTPNFKTLDLTVLRNFTLGPDVVFTSASSIITDECTSNHITATTLDATTIHATNITVSNNVTVDNLLASQTLRLTANSNQILVGSPNITTFNIDCSANRTIGVPSTGGLNANVVLTEGAQTINGVKTFTDMVVFLSSFSIASLSLTAVANQLVMGTGQTVTLNAPTPAASVTYTTPDVGANASFVMTEGAQTLNGVKTFSATAVFLAGFSLASLTLSAVTNQLTLGAVSTITVSAPTPAASRTYTMTDVLANASFVMTEGAQTLNGVKTFSATAVFLAGFSLASLTLSAVSNQLTLGAGNTITLTAPTPAASRTYTIPDVLANASFVMTEGTQSISGAKTFFNNVTFDAMLVLNNTSVIQFSKPTNQMTFTTGGNTVTLNVAASAANRTYTVDDIGVNASFVMNSGTQSIDGFKTFLLPTTFQNGILISAATSQIIFGSPFTITVSAPAPAAPRVYTMTDVLANASFVMTEGTQTINGAKTFSGLVTMNAGFTGTTGTMTAVSLTNTTNQITMGTGQTIIVNAPTPAASRVYTMPDVLANASFVMTEGTQTINGAKTFSGLVTMNSGLSTTTGTFTAVTNQLVLGVTNTTTINSVAPAASRVYTIPDAGGAASFVMTESAQTINGAKTFGSAVTISPTTNQLVLGVTNTTTITSPAPAASRTYTIPDAGGAASFVMTAGNQTIAGNKSFTGLTGFSDVVTLTGVASIMLPTSGGTPTALSFYEVSNTTINFTAATVFTGTQSPTMHISRIGNTVSIVMDGFSVNGNSGGGGLIASVAAVPSRFRPISNCTIMLEVINAGVLVPGIFSVATNGTVTVAASTISGSNLVLGGGFASTGSSVGFITCATGWTSA